MNWIGRINPQISQMTQMEFNQFCNTYPEQPENTYSPLSRRD